MLRFVSLVVPTRALSLSTSLVQTLKSESKALQEVTAAFVPVMAHFRIFLFWEQWKTDLIYKRDFIVEESSAAPLIDNTERCGIAADHREMCRFDKSDNSGFRIVIATLRRYAREAPGVVEGRCQRYHRLPLNDKDCQAGSSATGQYLLSTPRPLLMRRRLGSVNDRMALLSSPSGKDSRHYTRMK